MVATVYGQGTALAPVTPDFPPPPTFPNGKNNLYSIFMLPYMACTVYIKVLMLMTKKPGTRKQE